MLHAVYLYTYRLPCPHHSHHQQVWRYFGANQLCKFKYIITNFYFYSIYKGFWSKGAAKERRSNFHERERQDRSIWKYEAGALLQF